jgi:hypothetical protein
MNKIIILGDGSNIIGEFVGVWCKGEWEKIDEEMEMGVEFEDWGKEEEEGEGWKVFGYDGMGVLVCDVKKDGKKCVREYWKMVKSKY